MYVIGLIYVYMVYLLSRDSVFEAGLVWLQFSADLSSNNTFENKSCTDLYSFNESL